MNWNGLRGLDSQSHFVATNVDNCDYHVITDHDALVNMSRQHQHEVTPCQVSCVINPLKSAGVWGSKI
jgi:hypothetical protein